MERRIRNTMYTAIALWFFVTSVFMLVIDIKYDDSKEPLVF